MTIAELLVRLNADPSGLERGMSAGVRTANRFANAMHDVGRSITVAVTAPLALAGAAAVSAAADFDSLRRGMVAVTGSASRAEEQLDRMKDVAKLPGLGFREAIQGSIRLQAVGISASNAERYLRAFGNAVATTGGGKNELDRITIQLGQLSAKGKVLMQDIRPIIEAAPAVGRAMREAFGTVDTEAIQESGITTADFLNRLVTQLEKLPPITGGAKNDFENLTDSMYRARVAIGNALLPAILPLVQGLANMLEKVNTLNPETVRWAIAIAAVAAAVGPLLLVLSSLTSAVTGLAAAIGIGLLPVVAVGAPLLIGLAALSALWAKNKLDALAAAAAADQFKASLIGMSEAQLLATQTAARMELMTIHAAEASLRHQNRAFRNRSGAELAAVISATPPGAPLPDLTRRVETREMRALGNEANTAGMKIAATTRALEQLRTAATQTTTPLNLGGGGADKLAGTLDRVNDELRRFLDLSRFEGVTDENQLADQFAEQLQLVDTLGNRVDSLGDALDKLGARAPQGALTMLQRLQDQLSGAREELERMADQWNRDWARVVGPDTRPVSVAATTPATTGRRTGVVEDLGLDRFGASLTATGSLLGDLGTQTSLAGKALLFLREGTLQAGRALVEMLGNAASQGGQFASNFANVTQGMMRAGSSFAAAAPQAFALAGAFEVLSGFMSALQPVLDAVTLPLRILGEILAMLIVPVMRILFPVFKVVAIVASYLAETIAKVVAFILNAVGTFVRALGKFINAIVPFANPGNPLVKAGDAMKRSADQFKDAASEMAARRKELQGLSFEDALGNASKAADRLSESLTNAVEGFKLEPLRFAAIRAPQTGAQSPQPPQVEPMPGGGGVTNNVTVSGMSMPVTIHTSGDGRDSYRKLWNEMRRLADVNPWFKHVFAQYPIPA